MLITWQASSAARAAASCEVAVVLLDCGSPTTSIFGPEPANAMPILAFDCCFSAVSAAVLDFDLHAENRVLASRFEAMATGQAERLFPLLTEVMREAGVTFPDLTAVAVTVGPGTFTGIRTGVAAARGLALARGLPVLAMSSLALLARTAMSERKLHDTATGSTLAVAMDARQGLVFFQAFSAVDRMPLSEPALLSPSEAIAQLPSGPILAVGSASATLVAASLSAGHAAKAALQELLPDVRWTSRSDLAKAAPPSPLYLRQPDARPQTGASLPRATP
jgi:tRNA threonylcarbamoyladenosine biosynthesis protein TsaB